MFDVFEVPILMLQYALARARVARHDDEGASAIEWAVISAVVVTAAVVIGGIIYTIVNNKKDVIQQCGGLAANNTNANC